ncbi:ubiquinone biosynthesis protein UbiJ [Halospina denitrificans]|uniref:Ubiquinone biosynthesis accessory factor UbiJ n=1 Tax=Halospina denitrificans TaxID=332522 RepID=A0A4R7JR14_9GAMM|nr:SCP2 sterol-binding domain-containing protein [Halospina denitrificans]TDT40146.1 ubiquinone biosynthesis protein UbiJ [Halospina denitrificans]
MSLRETLEQSLTGLAEAALNHGLALDPGTRASVLAQLGSPVSFHLEPPGLALSLVRSGDGVRLTLNDPTAPSAVVRGTPLSMLSLALGDATPLHQGRLVIEGEEERVAALTHTLAELDPDLESVLAGVMGDVPAHLLARRLRSVLGWTQQAHEALFANIEDYIQEEAGVVPPRNEAEVMFEDVQNLADRTDNLEARIEALSQQSGPETP